MTIMGTVAAGIREAMLRGAIAIVGTVAEVDGPTISVTAGTAGGTTIVSIDRIEL
jgi:hypothetical protein